MKTVSEKQKVSIEEILSKDPCESGLHYLSIKHYNLSKAWKDCTEPEYMLWFMKAFPWQGEEKERFISVCRKIANWIRVQSSRAAKKNLDNIYIQEWNKEVETIVNQVNKTTSILALPINLLDICSDYFAISNHLGTIKEDKIKLANVIRRYIPNIW